MKVHGEVSERANLGLQQARLAITLKLILPDGIAIVPARARRLALKLKGEDGKTVEKENEVDTLPLLVIDLVHDRQDILRIETCGLSIKARRGTRTNEVQLDAAIERHAIPHDIDQAPVSDGGDDLCKDGLVRTAVVESVEPFHLLRLCPLEKVEEEVDVHGTHGVVARARGAVNVATIFHEVVNDEVLEGALREGVLPLATMAVVNGSDLHGREVNAALDAHGYASSVTRRLPVTYS